MTKFHWKQYFQQMMKNTDPVKIEQLAADALRRILAQVPAIGRLNIRNAIKGGEREIDLIADIEVFGQRHTLIAEVKSNGQPRYVRSALLQLQEYMRRRAEPATPVLIAPYLSVEAQDLCREYETAYLDLEGNARLAFGTVFISRQVASRPQVERRELRSLFKPKSAQVLRQMLRDPGHSWRVAELAKAAGVSLGLVSNVRTGLLDREWARLTNDGMLLSDPDALLDAWSAEYEPPPHQRLGFYTTLHGASFNEAVRRLPATSLETGSTALASFSAAQWLAPYGRIGTHYFYADQQGLESLRSNLKLSPASKGENVVVMLLDDPGLFLDNTEPAPGVVCTSPVQTYLDLFKAGERGQEAAEHLRREQLKWTQ
ncbi:type IV toxin-antitoxin system AbiEi family antitoxin [Pseudomonas asplenii]|nr:type IV toxin-antitoxin system AbiEi family antitoxin [Pseudomonas fuscovaginae]